MERFHRGPSIRKRVFAVFASGAHSFDLPRDATFADLAGRLARLGERYDEVLVRVEVTTNARSAAKHDAPAATHLH